MCYLRQAPQAIGHIRNARPLGKRCQPKISSALCQTFCRKSCCMILASVAHCSVSHSAPCPTILPTVRQAPFSLPRFFLLIPAASTSSLSYSTPWPLADIHLTILLPRNIPCDRTSSHLMCRSRRVRHCLLAKAESIVADQDRRETVQKLQTLIAVPRSLTPKICHWDIGSLVDPASISKAVYSLQRIIGCASWT